MNQPFRRVIRPKGVPDADAGRKNLSGNLRLLDSFVLFLFHYGMPAGRRFPPPWTIVETEHGFVVRDANAFPVARVAHRQDLHDCGDRDQVHHLTREEACRIALGIARLPELVLERHGFAVRGPAARWKPSHPYHVALDDSYIRRYWPEINALCAHNGILNSPTGERFEREGRLWCVYEFAIQRQAILFWDRFEGRWLQGDRFIHPTRPKDMPQMKPIPDWERVHGKWRR